MQLVSWPNYMESESPSSLHIDSTDDPLAAQITPSDWPRLNSIAALDASENTSSHPYLFFAQRNTPTGNEISIPTLTETLSVELSEPSREEWLLMFNAEVHAYPEYQDNYLYLIRKIEKIKQVLSESEYLTATQRHSLKIEKSLFIANKNSTESLCMLQKRINYLNDQIQQITLPRDLTGKQTKVPSEIVECWKLLELLYTEQISKISELKENMSLIVEIEQSLDQSSCPTVNEGPGL